MAGTSEWDVGCDEGVSEILAEIQEFGNRPEMTAKTIDGFLDRLRSMSFRRVFHQCGIGGSTRKIAITGDFRHLRARTSRASGPGLSIPPV